MNNMPDRNSAYGEPLDDSEMDEDEEYDYPGDYRADYNGDDDLDDLVYDEDEEYEYTDGYDRWDGLEPTRIQRLKSRLKTYRWCVVDLVRRHLHIKPNSDDLPF